MPLSFSKGCITFLNCGRASPGGVRGQKGQMLSSSLRRLVVKVRPLLFPDQSDSVDTGSDLLMWTLVENYTHMDLAVIGELNLDSCLAALQLDPPVYSTTSPGELSYGKLLYCATYYNKLLTERQISF